VFLEQPVELAGPLAQPRGELADCPSAADPSVADSFPFPPGTTRIPGTGTESRAICETVSARSGLFLGLTDGFLAAMDAMGNSLAQRGSYSDF
jgi:hypothetical protein